MTDFAKLFRSLERCNVLCSHALSLASPLAEKGRSSSLIRSNLFRMLIHELHEFRTGAKKLSRSPRRSQMLAVAKAVHRCLRRLRHQALRNPRLSLVHGFTLLYLLTGIEYLLMAQTFAFDPPGYRETVSLAKLTYPLENLNLRVELPNALEECPQFLMREMRYYLSFSWSTPMKFFEPNPPDKSPTG
jgi:hypothetical protein